MAEPANLLMTDETVVFDVRHHPLALWRPAVAGIAYLALWIAAISAFDFFRNGVMIVIGIALFLALSAWATWSALAFSRAFLTLTDRRLIYRSGVLSRQLREVPLSKITDVSVYQSVPGRVVGLGDIAVVTAGEPGVQLPFLNMPHPEQLKVQVLEQMHELERRAASPGDVAREIAHAMNRTQPTAEIGAIPPERPPLYSEIVDQIERLDVMRERGVLTGEEFQRAKEALLDRLDRERGAMIADYHIHTHLCGHARGTIRELVQSAVRKGFREVGIADHLPLTYVDDRSLSMGPRDLPRYVEEVLAAREEFKGDISVKLGIEADYHPPTMDGIAGMLEAHPFDYVIGSVHVLGDWIFDDPRTIHRYDGLDIDAFYMEYLEAETAMARTGLYNIIGHADLAKKFGNRASIDLAPHYRELLREAGRAGMCYEVNTAGLRWPAGEVYPEQAFVRIGAEMGVPVALGSDSHCPEDVGRDFDVALEIIRGAGYRELATFAERRMTLVPLDET